MTAKTCPDCQGPIRATLGKTNRTGRVTRKAAVLVTHRLTCPQWLRRARGHGAHPDITTLTHEDERVKITERSAA